MRRVLSMCSFFRSWCTRAAFLCPTNAALLKNVSSARCSMSIWERSLAIAACKASSWSNGMVRGASCTRARFNTVDLHRVYARCVTDAGSFAHIRDTVGEYESARFRFNPLDMFT